MFNRINYGLNDLKDATFLKINRNIMFLFVFVKKEN